MPDARPAATIWSATPTPFLDNGTLDDAGLERLIAQHARLKVTGLFLGGTCGEGPFMPGGQRAELVRKIKKLGAGRFHLAVQVTDTSPVRVGENIDQAVDAGADSVVIAPPWLKAFVNREFARRYFLEALAHRCPVEMALYVLQQPAETGIDLALWKELAAHPRVAYMKDSSDSVEFRAAFIQARKSRPGLRLLTGAEFDVVAALRDGYDGALMGTAILNAGLIGRGDAALRQNKATGAPEADAWQTRSNRLLYDIFRPDLESWLAGLKYALRRRGVFTTEFSHLFHPLDDQDRRRIDAALEREAEFI